MREVNVGDVIDRRYRLRREIARGGAGCVYEARHEVTGRIVALKMLNAEAQSSEELRARLLREAEVLGDVRHHRVVEVLDAGTDSEERAYLAMEMLEGRPLDGILAARRRLEIADAILVGIQVCEALEFMHRRGVVHRDLKPSNLFVVRDDNGAETIKLLDFGVAAVPIQRSSGAKLTQQGELLGTPEYMAPEQLLGRDDVDARADIYALGMTLFECLAGDVAFTGSYPEILLKAVGTTPLPALETLRTDVPPLLARVLECALSREMHDRFADAAAFRRAICQATGVSSGSLGLLGIARAPAPVAPAMAAPVAVAPAEPRERRRRFARAPYLTPMRIMHGESAGIDARSEDISEGGMLVMAARAGAGGETVQVRFALPTTGTLVTVPMIIRWSKPARARFAMGLEFVELPSVVRESIATYVQLMAPALDAGPATGAAER